MAASDSETWRNRAAGIALAAFGSWNVASGELLPFPTRQKVEGLAARLIGGLIVLTGLALLARTLPRRDEE